MKVSDVLDERIIDLNVDAKDKDEVLTILSKKLKDAGYIDNVETFKKDIYYRESLGAIPHGKSDSVTNVGIAIARLNHEIKWETLDGKGVKFVFLFAVSNNNDYARNHMMLLADIAGKLGNDELVEKLLNTTDVKELKELFA